MARIAFMHGSNDLYGASRVLVDDVAILARLGHEVSVILPAGGPLSAPLTAAGAKVSVEPLRVLRKVDLAASLRPPLRLPAAATGADVVVVWTLALAGYLPRARVSGARVVCSVHEILPGAFGTALARLTTSLSHQVMANSETTAQWLRQAGVAGAAVTVAYPVAPGYAPLAPRPPALPGELRAVLAGRVNGHKGHLEAVRATRLVREAGVDVRLSLIGGSYPGQEIHREAVVAEIADAPWAEFIGEVPEIRPYLVDADVVLMPTTVPEPFGVVALESWAAGRRLIGSDSGGLSEALRLVEGIAVPPRDNQALADAMIRVARDPALRASPGADAPVAHTCTREARERAWGSMLASSVRRRPAA